MHFHFQPKNGVRRVPRPVQECLRKRFSVSQEYVTALRCLEHGDIISEKPVKRIRVFNPRLAHRQHVSIRTWADLDQNPDFLLYEGCIDVQGNVTIEDLRRASYPYETSDKQL